MREPLRPRFEKNLPNEPGSWDQDFGFAYLERLYRTIADRYRFATLGDAPDLMNEASPTAFVRHDVDVSLERALQLARRERTWGVAATYHVLVDCPFYDVHGTRSRELLAELVGLGHEVGLHYDVVARARTEAGEEELAADIDAACVELANALGGPVRSLSFHMPIERLHKGPLRIAGRTSGVAEELMRWYLSDSRARWREGEPLTSLDRPRSHVLQILVHPIWWGEEHQRPEHRLRDFLLELAAARGESYEALHERMASHILYRAADLGPAVL